MLSKKVKVSRGEKEEELYRSFNQKRLSSQDIILSSQKQDIIAVGYKICLSTIRTVATDQFCSLDRLKI